tara:strand:- start:1210 stop:2910 length:1701 start_codon:yes stop_codon:yes gene_type:complete
MYQNLLRYYIPITENIVPWGDPFTYEIGYYELLNRIYRGEFYQTISYIFESNWYWLQKILLLIFSPVLINEPYSLCIINYFVYVVASILLYVLLIELDVNKALSRLLSIGLWIYPINYHFKEYSALPMMGLDSTFLGSLYCVVFSYLTFLKKPSSKLYQISFSIFLCAAFIGRGNAITVIALVLFFPTIYFLIQLIKNKNYIVLKNFIIPSIFFFVTVLLFYSLQLKGILNYYSVFQGFLTKDMSLTLPYLKHIPGIFFLYPDYSEIDLMNKTDFRVFSISIFCHIINFLTFFLVQKVNDKNFKLLAYTGLFIFYGTFFINLLLWMNPHINIYNAQLIWAPMRIGLILTFSFIIIRFFTRFGSLVSNLLFVLLFLSIFFTSNLIYKKNMDEAFKNKSYYVPNEIRKIDTFIKQNSKPKSVIILWFGPNLSPRILNYYSIKDKKELLDYYRGKYADYIWNQSDTSEEFKQKVKNEIENIFNNVNLIVLNESSKNFAGPYAWARYKEYITTQIQKGKLNDFKVIGTVKSHRGNLLILKRVLDVEKNFSYEIIGNNDYIIKSFNVENIF